MPHEFQLPFANWIGGFMEYLVNDAHFGLFTFTELTRFIAVVIEYPYTFVLSLLSSGFLLGQGSDATQLLPSISWVAVLAGITLFGYFSGGARLALLVFGCFGFIGLFGQWDSAMVTLASILIAVPISLVGGLLLGIASYRWRPVELLLKPILDLMQTVPVFAYLVPILFLFGFGPNAAIIATIIYALPPMTRISLLALRGVSGEIRDLGKMIGCTARQMTWRIMLPSAMRSIMVGVNQVIMLALNMVIIASMIGAGGLGYEVLTALRRLDIGAGLESGLAIVALAIALDRLSQSFAVRARHASHKNSNRNRNNTNNFLLRNPYTSAGILLVIGSGIAGLMIPAIQTYPESMQISTNTFWSDVVRWININFFDQLETFKNTLLLNILIPFKRFLISLPWLGVTGLLMLTGYTLGGLRLALLVGILATLIASTGLWEKSMITVYLCGISVILACLLGIPAAILTAERRHLWKWMRTIIDTLQTLPSFVYLMPVVMLFRVGDFTAMIAVIAYAIAPAIRYTAHGLQRVEAQLIEAGLAVGCTPWQLMTKIKLKLALPEIMLGLNQTIMLALSMLVITALVGTRDLGQEVYIALTKADTGRGLVAGVAVAFIAIIADRLIAAGAERMRGNLRLTKQALPA